MTKTLSFKDKKVIVFDLDGTIVDLTVNWAEVKRILAERFSKVYKQESCSFESISRCLDAIIEKDDMAELEKNLEIVREHELRELPNTKVIPETVWFINNVKKFGIEDRTILVIFSLNSLECIKQALIIAGILNKFDFFIGRESVKRWKPDPEGLLKIQDHYKCRKEEIVFFGDDIRDIEAGNNAGIEANYIDEIFELVRSFPEYG